MRTLAITQNITVDGSVEMLGDWFDPQGQGDSQDLIEEMHTTRTAPPTASSSAAGPSKTCAATGRGRPRTRLESPNT